MARKPTNVYKPKNSPFYYTRFEINGRTYRSSTGCTDKEEAKGVAKALKVRKERELADAPKAVIGAPPTIQEVAWQYWRVIGHKNQGDANTKRDLERLVDYFGKDRPMTRIFGVKTNDEADEWDTPEAPKDVSTLVKWRQQHKVGRGENARLVAPSTVNRSTTVVLRTLFSFAKKTWRKVHFCNEPLDWNDFLFKEPVERVRELVGDEWERLRAAIREDLFALFGFAKLTGLRLEEVVTLVWSEVNFDAKQIVKIGKGGKRITTRITSEVLALLEPLKGHHPEFVFTYIAQRHRPERVKGKTYARTGHRETGSYIALRDQEARVKGRRYPFTYEYVKSVWERACGAAGVENLRFHDLRHDFGTKLLRKKDNLKMVSRALNHSSLSTTMKYAHVTDQDLHDTLEAFHSEQAAAAKASKSVIVGRHSKRLKAI